ncbi:MAG: glutathione peroxidase [Planctomycetota bacterium]|nr:MAG: glutathione peroxidase [Planctomycetota bacterium]
MSKIYDIQLKSIDLEPLPFENFRGKLVLIVNVASECGLTPQYSGLETLFQKYSERGLIILGLPCNQFGAQEPGSEKDIVQFCESKFKITFSMTSKIDVNGDGRHDLYKILCDDSADFPGDITWNFEKFLIGKNGEVINRFSPKTTPEDSELLSTIESNL